MPSPDLPTALSTKTCICYISDEGYLFASLVGIQQLRENVSSNDADIVMFCIGTETPTTEAFRKIYERIGARFIMVPRDAIDNMHIVFARLFIDRFAPAEYSQFLYIDGDTQIAESLDALVNVKLPPDRFCAARDPMALAIEWNSPSWRSQRQYFEKIGIPIQVAKRYFNAGILRFERQSWAKISSEALSCVADQKVKLRFKDQDALNLVANDKCLTMSFKWNFPIFLLNAGVGKRIAPAIYHFMSDPRPWHGPFQPWGQDWHDPYLQLVKDIPEISQHLPRLTKTRYLKYYLQQYYKKYTERVNWGSQDIHDKIAAIEADVFV